MRAIIISLKMTEVNFFNMTPKGIRSRKFPSSIFIIKMIIAETEKTIRIRNLQRKRVNGHSISFLHVFREWPSEGSSRRVHSAARSVTMAQRRVIRSSSVIGCEDTKKEFAIWIHSGKAFGFNSGSDWGSNSSDSASCRSRVCVWIVLKYSSLILTFVASS